MNATYCVYGLWVESEIPLPDLPVAMDVPLGAPRVRIRLSAGAPIEVSQWILEYSDQPGSAPWCATARHGQGYLLRFHGIVDFLISPESAAIDCWPGPAGSEELVAHLLADQALPSLLHLRGQPSFHASAVALDDRLVVGFLGASGRGKSTLAAGLGHPFSLVCDDALALHIGRAAVTAFPSSTSVRLWNDSVSALRTSRAAPRGAEHIRDEMQAHSELTAPQAVATDPSERKKQRVATRAGLRPLRLHALYLLEPADACASVQSVSRRDAVVELAKHLCRMDPLDQASLRTEFDTLAELVRLVRVARLIFRHRYEELPTVRDALLRDVQRHAVTGEPVAPEG
jgi:hypothetical protein